jgi:glycosyltransferase involved in cell wall biosynthesis
MCYARALASTGKVNVFLCSFQLPHNLECRNEIEPNIFLIGKPKTQIRGKLTRNLLKLLYPVLTIGYFYRFSNSFRNYNFSWFFFPIKLFNDISALIYIKGFRHEDIFCEKNELKIGMLFNQTRGVNSLSSLYNTILFPFFFLDAFLNDRVLYFYNGVIAISTKIEKFARRFNKKVIRIPVLTHVLSNNNNNFRESPFFLIGFTGSVSINKEGLIDLIHAIAILKSKGTPVILNIYGSADKNSFIVVKNLIHKHNLRQTVFLHGNIKQNEVSDVLTTHHLLVMTRRSNVQTEYGFSTKFAEYLASGTPTLVTDVSDNKLFIEDGVNGFIVEPGNVESLAEIMYKICQRKDLLTIGENGKATAKRHFDFALYSEVLYEFFFKHSFVR